MRRGVVVASLLALSSAAGAARADDLSVCLDAASKGQRFRDTHRLVEARDQLRVCAAAQCPSVVQQDCAGWLAQVESALPTVVLSATTPAGADLPDVRVTVDGRPFASRLDGHALEIDAGSYTFHFESAAGTVEKQVVVKEGAKDQPVSVVIGTAAPAGVPGPPAPAPPPAAPVAREPSRGLGTQRTVALVLGGIGIAGLAVGGVFGVIAVAKRADVNDHCTGNLCDPTGLADTRDGPTDGNISTVALAAGGALVAGALVTWLTAPAAPRKTGIVAAPLLGRGTGGLSLEGAW